MKWTILRRFAAGAFLWPALAWAELPLETETARLTPKGQFEFDTAF